MLRSSLYQCSFFQYYGEFIYCLFLKLLLNRTEFRTFARNRKVAHFPYLSNGVLSASIRRESWKWRPKQSAGPKISEHRIVYFYNCSQNARNFQNLLQIEELRLFHTFTTVYHLHQSDKRFGNDVQNTVWEWINPWKDRKSVV